jgi:hypothetical protein
MTSKINLILALQQVENIGNLVQGNDYERFINSHLISIECELKRQLSLQNNGKTVN